MKMHLASPCLQPGNDCSDWRVSKRAPARFGLLMAVITLLVSVMLSSCATTSSAGSSAVPNSSNNPANGSAAGSSSTPGPVQSSVGDHGVILSWNSSISSGVVGYNVYRGYGSGGPYVRLNSSIVPATNYTDSAVQAGQTYYYVVTATNSGNLESDFSQEVAAPIP